MKTSPLTFPLLLATGLLLPAACGGGGGGGAPSAAQAAEVWITSPTARVTTTAETIRVRGTASPDSDIANLTVGGTPATSSNGFADWTAEVPLQDGGNPLVVVVTDSAGQVAEKARTEVTRRASLLNGGNAFVPSPDGTRIYYIDNTLEALVEVEVASKAQRVVAQGSFFQSPNRICLDPTGTFAYITDLKRDGVIEVLLSTGAVRTVTSTSMNSSFPLLGGPDDLVYDLGHGPARLILSDYTRDGLVAVEIATGIRSYISKSGQRGSGPAFTSPRGICWSGPDTVLVCDLGTDDIYEVNVVSGTRTVIASSTVGSGTSITGPYDIEPTSNPDEFLYVDLAQNKLVRLNRATRQRTLVRERTQAADSWVSTNQLAIDPVTDRPLVLDAVLDAIFRINPVDGSQEDFLNQSVGSGRALRNVGGVDHDPATGRIIGADFSRSEIVGIEIATGERTVLWTQGTGGQTLNNPAHVAVIEPGVRYAITDEESIYNFDVASGEVSLLSGAAVSFGQGLQANYRTLHYAAQANLLLGTDGKTLFSIDLTTGRRTVRSSTNGFNRLTGIDVDESGGWVYAIDNGDRRVERAQITSNQFWSFSVVTDGANTSTNGFSSPTDLALNPDGTQVIVVDRSRRRLMAVDTEGGARLTLSGPDDNDNLFGLGAGFSGVESVLWLPQGGLAVLDQGLDALLIVDPILGDRSVIAR